VAACRRRLGPREQLKAAAGSGGLLPFVRKIHRQSIKIKAKQTWLGLFDAKVSYFDAALAAGMTPGL
jgi:hypothetical protein